MKTYDLYRCAKLEANNTTDSNDSWNENSWWDWATEKLMEHVSGEVNWLQFEQEKFGILNQDNILHEQLSRRFVSFKNRELDPNEHHAFIEDLNTLLA